MSDASLRKHPLVRAAHYLFLLPFVPALRPLLVNFRVVDMAVYGGGVILVIFLVVYGNHRPLVVLHSGHLSLYLHYRHTAEIHPFSQMEGFRRLKAHRVMLYSRDHRPVPLTLTRRNADALVSRLRKEGIPERAPSS